MNMQKSLDGMLAEGLAQGCYPGAVAACGCGSQVCAISHVGEISQNGPSVDRHTRYDMASLTKVMAPTMIAFQAIEEGKLTLFDTLGFHFDNVPED